MVQTEDAASEEEQRQDASQYPGPTAIRQDDSACQASNSFLHRALVFAHLSHGCKAASEVAAAR